MLFTFLDKTRAKSFAVRQRYAFATAAAFTVVVALVWTLSLPARFVMLVSRDAATTESASVAPFSSMWGQLKDQFSSITIPKFLVTTTTATSTSEETTTFDARDLLTTSTTPLKPERVAQEVLIEMSASNTLATTTGATSTQP